MRRWARWISILVLTLTLIVSAKPVPETILQLFEAGELKEAEKRLRLEMKGLSDAEKAPLARVLADVLFEQNRLEDSLDWHREVYRHHPDAQIAGLSLCYVGEIYVILGRRQDAEQSFRQLLAESPDSVAGLRATEGLADLAMEVGRLDEAEKLLDSAAIGWERIGDKAAWAENLAQKAQLLLRRTEYELALGAAERSVAVMPSAGGLTVRAQAYHAQLKFDEAIACYEEALAFSEQRFGKSSQWALIARTGMGIALIGRKDYAEALEVYLAIPDAVYPDRPFYLSYLYEELERPADAVVQARVALQRTSSLPPGLEAQARAILVRSLLSLDRLTEAEQELVLLEQLQPSELAFDLVLTRCRLLRSKGRYLEARRLLEDLTPPQETSGQAKLAEAWALVCLGEEKIEEAKFWLEKAIVLRGEDAVGPWVFLRLAEVEALTGQSEAAKEYINVALSRARARYGGRHLLTASKLYEAADLYIVIGEGTQAEDLLRQSLEIYRSKLGNESFESLLVATKLGLHQVATGSPAGRLTLVDTVNKAEALAPERRREIEALACLGLSRVSADDKSALEWLNRGLQSAEGPYRVVYLIGLASKLIEKGRMDEAQVYARKVLDQTDIPALEASAYMVLAESYRQADPDQARAFYQKALALDDTSISALLARTSLATLYLNDQRPELALPILQKAMAQERRFRTTSGDLMYVGSLTVETLLSLDQMEEALVVADGTLARSLSKLIAKQTAGDLAGIPSEQKRRLDDLERQLSEVESELRSSDPLQGGRRRRQSQLLERQEELSETRERLLKDLTLSYPGYSELLSPSPIELSSVQSELGEDEVAILYYLGLRSFVFIVTRDTMSFTELRTSSDEINALVESYSRSIGSGKFTRAKLLSVMDQTPPASTDETHKALYDALLAPLENYRNLVDDRSFIIVPTQNLWMIPFESLPGLQGEKYLVQERSISYSPSLSLFVRFRQLRSKQRSSLKAPLVLGGANYGDRAAPLPYAQLEAAKVAARWGDSSLYQGDRATEAVYLKNPQTEAASLIHFATHGVLGQSPSLLLTATEQSDGRLEMSEILSQPIEASLVTLSACSSGRGWLRPGEGVVGLSRAFLHAGASSVMVSLWNVNDRSTARLMELFYDELERLGPSKALRQAQLQMIQEGATLGQWAPFVVVGAP